MNFWGKKLKTILCGCCLYKDLEKDALAFKKNSHVPGALFCVPTGFLEVKTQLTLSTARNVFWNFSETCGFSLVRPSFGKITFAEDDAFNIPSRCLWHWNGVQSWVTGKKEESFVHKKRPHKSEGTQKKQKSDGLANNAKRLMGKDKWISVVNSFVWLVVWSVRCSYQLQVECLEPERNLSCGRVTCMITIFFWG